MLLWQRERLGDSPQSMQYCNTTQQNTLHETLHVPITCICSSNFHLPLANTPTPTLSLYFRSHFTSLCSHMCPPTSTSPSLLISLPPLPHFSPSHFLLSLTPHLLMHFPSPSLFIFSLAPLSHFSSSHLSLSLTPHRLTSPSTHPLPAPPFTPFPPPLLLPVPQTLTHSTASSVEKAGL